MTVNKSNPVHIISVNGNLFLNIYGYKQINPKIVIPNKIKIYFSESSKNLNRLIS